MFWFNSKERKKKMEFLSNFRPTSKLQLKQVCMWFNNGDTRKAQEMFDYYVKDLDLPDFDPIQPNWVDNTKTTINDLFSWFKANKEEIAQGYEFIRSFIQNKGALPPVAQNGTNTPLPPIND